jgi:hypothetical protein
VERFDVSRDGATLGERSGSGPSALLRVLGV